MENKITVVFKTDKINVDIEIPTDISAYELLLGLNRAYGLGITDLKIARSSLSSENPTALLKGGKKLYQYGIHNGTVIYYRS